MPRCCWKACFPVLTVRVDFLRDLRRQRIDHGTGEFIGRNDTIDKAERATPPAAPIGSPVSSISMACLGATLRDSATMGVEQNRPISTPGVQN